MSYLRRPLVSEDDRYYVKTEGFVLDAVLVYEIFCGIPDPAAFFKAYGLLSLSGFLVSAGFDLHENYRRFRTGGHENKIDLAVFTAEIACDEFVAMLFQEPFASVLTPSAEFVTVG